MSTRPLDDECLKRKLAPYQTFVRKVIQRTQLSMQDAKKRQDEPLDSMLDRVVGALDEALAAAPAPTAAPAPEAPKKIQKFKRPTQPKGPVIWRPSEGRKYPVSVRKNFHPSRWSDAFPAACYPLKVGLEVFLPKLNARAVIVGYNPSMRENKVMMLLKSAAQMELDYDVKGEEIRSWRPDLAIRYLRSAPVPAAAASPLGDEGTGEGAE